LNSKNRFAFVLAAAKEKVLDAPGQAASKLRSELGESLATVKKFDAPLAEATTSSLETLEAYSQGVLKKDPAAAARSQGRTTRSEFRHGVSGYWPGLSCGSKIGRAAEYFRKAFQLLGAQDAGQGARFFRIRCLGQAPGFPNRPRVEEPQSRESHGSSEANAPSRSAAEHHEMGIALHRSGGLLRL
jgi:hypothetical protein